MVRTKVNKGKILQMVQREFSDSQIAQTLGLSKQTVRAHRLKLLDKGMIQARLSFDEGVKALISLAELAKKAQELDQELWEAKNKLAATENELKNLRSEIQKQHENKQRWELAVRQGDIKTLNNN